jgi:hypothetical protein
VGEIGPEGIQKARLELGDQEFRRYINQYSIKEEKPLISDLSESKKSEAEAASFCHTSINHQSLHCIGSKNIKEQEVEH